MANYICPCNEEQSYTYRPNWQANLHITQEPIFQEWQIQKMRYKGQRTLGKAFWQDRTPKFYNFTSQKAFKIAHSLPLYSYLTWLTLAVLTALLYNPSSWLWWVLVGVVGVPFVIKTIIGFRQIIAKLRAQHFIGYGMQGVHAIVVDGKVGAGKTSSLLESYAILAKIQWEKMCKACSMLLPFLDDIPYWREDLRQSAQEILESYFFFLNSGTVPLLYTSVPCKVDGLFTNKLKADHLLQKERLPYGVVIIIDESSLVLPQNLYKSTPYNLIEFFKFLRHYGDFYVGATEQDENSNLIYLRRACGKVVHIIKQKHILKNKLLEWLHNFIETHSKESARRSVFLYKLNKIVANSGWRKYYYKEYYEGDEEGSYIKSFVVKPCLDISYSSRAYKQGYRCLDQKLTVSTWTSLYLTKSELREVFSDDLKKETMTKAQLKREATARRLARQKANKR